MKVNRLREYPTPMSRGNASLMQNLLGVIDYGLY